jgi:hypothetical protein
MIELAGIEESWFVCDSPTAVIQFAATGDENGVGGAGARHAKDNRWRPLRGGKLLAIFANTGTPLSAELTHSQLPFFRELHE